MKKQYTQLVAIILVCMVGFFAAVKTSVDHAVELLLVEEVNDTGMDWAHLIDVRINSLLTKSNSTKSNVENSDELLGIEEIKQLAEISQGVFEVGNIYQIDFINAMCHCEVSFSRSDFDLTKSTGGHDHHAHNHESTEEPTEGLRSTIQEHAGHQSLSASSPGTDRKSIDKEILSHVLGGTDSHNFVRDISLGALTQSETVIREIIQSGQHRIIFKNEIVDGHKSVVGQVFHPVSWGGEVRYVLRVLVDMTHISASYSRVLNLGVFAVLLLLFLSFVFPAFKYVRTARSHRLLDTKAHFLANHDVLTGISNRNAFQDQAPRRIDLCRCAEHEGVLLIVDINNFKEINDFYGHQVGDEVLQKVAALLQGLVSKDCIVARLGGDEFGVLSCETHLRNYTKAGDIELPTSVEVDIADRFEKLKISFSIGFARYPIHGANLPELMCNADLALYAAKKDGKAGAREYDPSMSQIFKDRVNLFRDFRNGLLASEIEPYYQPLVHAVTGKVEGLEALARWNHPERGVLSAGEFADVLEDREICGLVGREMLSKIMVDMGRWKASGIEFGSVGLNVDSADLLRPGFILDVISNLAKYDLVPSNLAIEVTENIVFGSNYNVLLEKLREFRELGCHVALDDFGTGFSSITHLKELPYTAIKIDKSFIRNIVSDNMDRSIVEALVYLSESIGYQVVAEGVETQEQLEMLTKQGCHLLQGYYFSEPLPAKQVPGIITQLNDTGIFHEVPFANIA
ncbi:MAG: putative bifunctional diguanylate cyclase/phosphodiesterase [Hyphomicrobiales bacterium]